MYNLTQDFHRIDILYVYKEGCTEYLLMKVSHRRLLVWLAVAA